MRVPRRVTGSAPPRPSRRTIGLAAALTACLVVALATAFVWNVGRQIQHEQAAASRPAASWSPGPRAMVDTSSQADIRALRAQGWAVPGLAAEGYRVADVRRTHTGQHPAVTITVHNDHDTVEIVEQRGTVRSANPLDGVTQLPVSAEGMHESAVSGQRLWVRRGDPWRVVMVRPGAVYTVSSDAPPATMAQAVRAIVAEDRGRVSLPSGGDEGFGSTVVHGLEEILE